MNIKKMLILCFLAVTTYSFAQDNIFFEEVIQPADTNLTQDQIYSKANEWFALNFKSANDVLQLQDKESGKLIGKGNGKINIVRMGGSTSAGRISFTLSVYCKDGRYKLVVSGVMHYGDVSGFRDGGDIKVEKPSFVPLFMLKGDWNKIRTAGYYLIDNLVTDLKKFINTDVNDDW